MTVKLVDHLNRFEAFCGAVSEVASSSCIKELLWFHNLVNLFIITAWFKERKYTIYNVYSPPTSTCTINDLQDTTYSKTILAGDFNGHSPQWGYNDTNSTGQFLEDLNECTNLIITQDVNSPPTLLHRVHGTLSRPDLTIVSSDPELRLISQVLSGIGSDHKPILTSLKEYEQNLNHEIKPRWNFKKGDWEKFKEDVDEKCNKIILEEQNVDSLNNLFCDIVVQASKDNIPRGSFKKLKPFWNKEIQEAVKTRHEARKKLENFNTLENKKAYNKASAVVRQITQTAKRNVWRDTCSKLDLRRDGRKAWTLLQNISGKKRKTNPVPMPNGETDQKRAEKLNKHFANVNKTRTDKIKDKPKLKELKDKERMIAKPPTIFTEKFTMNELESVLKILKKKKSPGPDKIHNEMLQNLGTQGKRVLLHLLNLTWTSGKLPNTWKNAIVTPILKDNKDPKEPSSYRPISLTSCVGKVGERIVNNRLYWWLEQSKTLTENQAGFRAKSRTEDQLFRFCQNIQDGFQNGMHTTAVFIDLQQAYDRIWKMGLLLKMQRLGITDNMYRWVKGFLQDRTVQTKLNNSLSSKRSVEDGLPQGSPLSCTLFLIYINDMVENIRSQTALYADDLVIWYTGKYTLQNARYLNLDLDKLNQHCKEWKIDINKNKTTYSIFTLSPKSQKQVLNIRIDDHQLAKEDNPKYLGIQLDSRLTMNKHVSNLKLKCSRRLSLLKKLTTSKWGADLETTRSLYIGYIRSVLEYCQCLIISSSNTTQAVLDRIQNNALRLICGGMKSSPISACEIMTNIEPLQIRRKKAVLDLHERCLRMPDSNPAKKLVMSWKPKTRLKHKSILHHVQELKTRCYLPDDRVEQKRVSNIPPHANIDKPEIKPHLFDPNINKSSNILELKRNAEATILNYPDTWIHVFTDGSAFKGTVNAGYGVLIQHPEGNKHEISAACGSFCSNYEAELTAIKAACNYLMDSFKTAPLTISDVVIFSDSKASLQAIDRKSNCALIEEILQSIDEIKYTFKNNVVLQWIPGHTDLPGNDHADKLAKKGSTLCQPEIAAEYTTAKHIIQQNFKEEWMNCWAKGMTGRVVYSHMNTINPKDKLKDLPRKEQSIIFQLRTQHAPINMHLNKINPQHPPMCSLCEYPYETVEHLLLHCPKLKDIRQKFLPTPPDITNTLYSSRDQLFNTALFYSMAQGRRASVQQPLD